MTTATVSQFTPTDPALASVMAQAIATYPDEAVYIHRGAELVARGHVREPANGKPWLIGMHGWEVTTTCPCPDTVLTKTTHCKHRWAKALYCKLYKAKPPVVRSLYYYAELHGQGGVATIYETGTILFQAYDEETQVPCTMDQVVLAGRKDLVDAYYAS